MQKIKIFLYLLFTICSFYTYSNNIEKADSLFNEKKYTAAISLYEKLCENGLSSQAMLLKMALIKEGLQRYDEALYYLYQLYRIKPNKEVMNKMESLSKSHNIPGFEFSDAAYFYALFINYKWWILASLAGLSVIVFAASAVVKKRSNVSVIAQIIINTILLLALNFLEQKNEALNMIEGSLLMSAPSSASETLIKIPAGTLLKIQSTTDVWCFVKINDTEGYIKATNLRYFN